MTKTFVKTINNPTKTVSETTAQKIINLLEELGVDTIFGYPGAAILPLYESLSKSKIKHVLCRHEQGAIHAAEGYARIKNKTGVVLVTSGPGFTNTLTGILNSKTDGTPIIIISGQSESLDNNEFQAVDIAGISQHCAKAYYELKKNDDTERIVKQAFKTAAKIPCGPVIITAPKSVLEEESCEISTYKERQEIKVEAPQSCVLKALETLKNAKRPIIIAGGGCVNAKNELFELSHLTHIPVVNTLMGKNCSDNLSLGLIGQSGNSELNTYINKSDVVLALGVRFTSKTTNNANRFLPNAKIISINIEKNISKNVIIEKEFIGELEVILQQMIGTIKAKNILFDIKYDWVDLIHQNKQKDNCTTEVLTQEKALEIINSYAQKYNPIITTDVGEHQISAAKIFKTNTYGKFLTSGGAGVMGYGIPAAIGAFFASPNSLIINITGDGSFQMNMQELGTIAEYNIPIKIFIMNNSSLGMIETTQRNKYNKIYQSTLINPDFQKIAEGYAIKSYSIKNTFELECALKEIFIYKKAVLLDIHL